MQNKKRELLNCSLGKETSRMLGKECKSFGKRYQRGWESRMKLSKTQHGHVLNLFKSRVVWDCSPKLGVKFHLKLNIGDSPIASTYREGKMPRTLKRELKVLEIVKREAIEAPVDFGSLKKFSLLFKRKEYKNLKVWRVIFFD